MKKVLTIGILAHVDAGKTTLSEAMLYLSGQLRRAGRVDHGDSFLDTDAIERDRGITIFSKQARLTTKDCRITLLDTPGHVDFSAETERTLQVLDLAVLLISGTDGVQGHTRTLWRLLQHYNVPVFFFVNKMDLPGAEMDALMEELKAELSGNCVAFPELDEAACSQEEFSASPSLLEEIAMCSDALLEQFTENGVLSNRSICTAIAGRDLFPVFFGSALKMEGVKELLYAMDAFAPGWPWAQQKETEEAFGARIYKISRDAQGNRLTFLKVLSGSLSVKDAVSYTSLDGASHTEKIDQIRLYSGEKYELARQVFPGEICGVTGLSDTMPGMGLGIEGGQVRPVLEAVMTRAICLPPDQNAALFYRKIKPLEEEDPALHLVWDEKGQEIRAQIMGQVQLEGVIGIGHFEPLRHYAEVQLLLEPSERGSGITVDSICSEDVLALNWQRLILTHVLECEHPGVLLGAPVTDLKITLLTGRAHLKHTEGGDFRQATYRAIRQGLMAGKSVLLEPYYHFLLEIPADCIGRALSDLARMHAEAGDPVLTGDRAKIEGRVMVSAVGSYVTDVHAYSRGSGSLSLTPDGYDLCRGAEEVLSAAHYDPSSDLNHPTGSVFCAHGAGYVVPWDEVPSHAHCELPRQVLLQVQDVLGEGETPSKGGESIKGYDVENGWGRGPEKRRGASSSKAGLSLEEDAELLAIYQREFGMDAASTQLDEEKRRRAAIKKQGSEGGKRSYPHIHQKYDKRGNPIYPKKDERKEFLIVDGYNIIFQWKELSDLSKLNIDAARDKLLDLLSNFQGYTAQRVAVVFDAYRSDYSCLQVSRWQNLEVIFTKKGETADAYIERLVHEETDRYKITVATSDGMEQLTVLRLGALRMSARMLREEMQRVAGSLHFL